MGLNPGGIPAPVEKSSQLSFSSLFFSLFASVKWTVTLAFSFGEFMAWTLSCLDFRVNRLGSDTTWPLPTLLPLGKRLIFWLSVSLSRDGNSSKNAHLRGLRAQWVQLYQCYGAVNRFITVEFSLFVPACWKWGVVTAHTFLKPFAFPLNWKPHFNLTHTAIFFLFLLKVKEVKKIPQ